MAIHLAKPLRRGVVVVSTVGALAITSLVNLAGAQAAVAGAGAGGAGGVGAVGAARAAAVPVAAAGTHALTIIFLLLLVFGVPLAFVWFALSRKKHQQKQFSRFEPGARSAWNGGVAADPQQMAPELMTAPEALHQVSERVVAADNAVRSAQEDLDFASAEFGAATAESLRPAYENATRLLGEAMEHFQHSQDALIPEVERAEAAREAISVAAKASAAASSLQQKLAQLREKQRDVDAELARVCDVIADLQNSLPNAQAQLEQLQITYPQFDLSSLNDNPEQATRLLESADAAAKRGAQALQRGDRNNAVQALRLAQRAIVQARTQLDAVNQADAQLQHVDQTLLTTIASLHEQVARAKQVQDPAKAAACAPLLEAADAAITFAQGARAGQQDPLLALEKLAAAENALAAVIGSQGAGDGAGVGGGARGGGVGSGDGAGETGGARAGSESEQRNQDVLRLTEQMIADVDRMIQTRRGSIGIEPRRLLQQAQMIVMQERNNPNIERQYLQLMQAQALVRQARTAADADVVEFTHRGGGSGFDFSYTSGRPSGFNPTTLALGGLLDAGAAEAMNELFSERNFGAPSSQSQPLSARPGGTPRPQRRD